MREIKFRVWDKRKKKWGNSSDVQYGGLNMIGWVCDPTDNYVIMQYTGLKDKNGKEIYEEDILSGPSRPMLVEWGIDGFIIGNYGEYLGEFLSSGRSKVILGNVHENKELLK